MGRTKAVDKTIAPNYRYTGTISSGTNPITGNPIVAPSWQGEVAAYHWPENGSGSLSDLADWGVAAVTAPAPPSPTPSPGNPNPAPPTPYPAGSILTNVTNGSSTQKYLVFPGYWIVVGNDGKIVVWASNKFTADYVAL